MKDFIYSILVYPFLDTNDYVAMAIGGTHIEISLNTVESILKDLK